MDNPSTASEHLSTPGCSIAPEFHPDSNGVHTIFPTSPAVGHPSAIHRNLQSPEVAQASALTQSPHATDATSTLRARSPPSILYPFNSLQSEQQLLEQQEARWHERFQTHVKRLENKSQEHQEECHRRSDEWYERCENKTREIREKSDEIATLIVEPSPLIFPTISN